MNQEAYGAALDNSGYRGSIAGECCRRRVLIRATNSAVPGFAKKEEWNVGRPGYDHAENRPNSEWQRQFVQTTEIVSAMFFCTEHWRQRGWHWFRVIITAKSAMTVENMINHDHKELSPELASGAGNMASRRREN